MQSVLGLRTEPSVPSMRDATGPVARSAKGDHPVPLAHATIASTLQFLVPPSVHGIPSSLLSRQLRNRHHFLSLTPEDQAAYFCLNPEHPSQDTSKVLSTLHELADQNAEDLARSIQYSTDGEDLLCHVITADPGALQFIFIWETPDASDSSDQAQWKYLDVKPFSPSNSLYGTLQEAEEAKLKVHSKSSLTREASAEDSYWSAYNNVAPSVTNGRSAFLNGLIRNESATGLSRGSASPRREEAYWDRYGYDSDEDDGEAAPQPVIAPPAAAVVTDPQSFRGYGPTHAWSVGGARFSPEDLSEALAMHLQPELAPSSDVAQGLAMSLNTPPPKVEPVQPPVEPVSPLQEFSFSDASVEQDTNSAMGGSMSSGEKAVAEATRGIYNL